MSSVQPLQPPQRLVRAVDRAPQETADATRAWLKSLPQLLRQQLDRWELTPERVVTPGGRSSLVVLVRQPDGAPAALKLSAPGPHTEQEAAALAHWDGRGAVRLLRADSTVRALLLERLHGEVSLRSLPDAKATLEAVSTARRLWVPPPEEHSFTTVADRTAQEAWMMRSLATEEIRPLIDEALELRDALTAGGDELLLLHGDFRQGAVLSGRADRAPWLAVGPEPVVGERAYDLARLVRDRLHDLLASPGAAAISRRRVAKLADSLDLDRERLRGWALYRAVESGVRHLVADSPEDGSALLEFASWL